MCNVYTVTMFFRHYAMIKTLSILMYIRHKVVHIHEMFKPFFVSICLFSEHCRISLRLQNYLFSPLFASLRMFCKTRASSENMNHEVKGALK